MEATRDDIEGLFELQRIDLEIKRLSKELDELPQRGIIVAARDKKTAIEAKSEQVAELKRATTKKITRIDDEDASLAKKEAGVQAAIDAAHGDFRNVEARTKELAGIVRRRATIAEDRAGVAAELDKISAMEAQISLALEEIGAKEQEAIDSFQKQGATSSSPSPSWRRPAARWRRRSPAAFGRLQPHGGSLRCGHRRARRQPLRRLPHGHRRRPSHRSAQPGTAGYVPLVQAFAGDRIISVALSPRAVL